MKCHDGGGGGGWIMLKFYIGFSRPVVRFKMKAATTTKAEEKEILV